MNGKSGPGGPPQHTHLQGNGANGRLRLRLVEIRPDMLRFEAQLAGIVHPVLVLTRPDGSVEFPSVLYAESASLGDDDYDEHVRSRAREIMVLRGRRRRRFR